MKTMNFLINGAQARMARAALDWNLPQTRERTGLSVNTVMRFEKGRGVQIDTIRKLVDVYRDAGIDFQPDGSVLPCPEDRP